MLSKYLKIDHNLKNTGWDKVRQFARIEMV